MPKLMKDLEMQTTWKDGFRVFKMTSVQTSSSSLVFAARTRQDIAMHWRYFSRAWREKTTLSNKDNILGEITVILLHMHKFQIFISVAAALESVQLQQDSLEARNSKEIWS